MADTTMGKLDEISKELGEIRRAILRLGHTVNTLAERTAKDTAAIIHHRP